MSKLSEDKSTRNPSGHRPGPRVSSPGFKSSAQMSRNYQHHSRVTVRQSTTTSAVDGASIQTCQEKQIGKPQKSQEYSVIAPPDSFLTQTEIEAKNILLQRQRINIKERPSSKWYNIHRAEGLADLTALNESAAVPSLTSPPIPARLKTKNNPPKTKEIHPKTTKLNKTKREVRPSSLDKDQQPRVVPNPAYSATSPTIDQYLAYVLSDMAASSKDESDYANLWDTKSRDTGSSYSTNQVVMDSIMRSKVNRTSSRDYAKRQAWRLEGNSASSSTENIADLLTDNNRSSGSFDMKKFESLKARVDNMDLKLFDFDHLSDLKHSSSLLELSTMLKSASSSDCNYTCHEGCEEKVHEQCQGADVNLLSKGDQSMACEDVDDTDSGYSGSGRSAGFTLSKEEIISRIKTYNESHGGSTTALKLSSDGSDVFQGVIQVYISLEKPIHMSLKSRPTSIYEALDRKAELSPSASPENTMSACQLPQDAPVSLHINSINKATEVVSMLLKKFNITDNPKTFALYEQSVEQEQEVKLRKIGDVELPLLNFLRWSTENQECSRRFVLKEHNSAEILWEAFSLPELKNFLRMFNAEESQGKDAIRAKYKLQQTQLLQRLSEINTEKRS